MRNKTVLSLLAATLVGGCSRSAAPPAANAAPGNWVRVLAVSPASSAKLRVGEFMRFKLAYSHTNARPVLIVAQPYAKGHQVDGYAGAASPAYPPGTGEDWSYFGFQHAPVEVDEVRVVMTDFNTHDVLFQTNLPIQAKWESDTK